MRKTKSDSKLIVIGNLPISLQSPVLALQVHLRTGSEIHIIC